LNPKQIYLKPLDGLRFFAFLSVFVHHLTALKSSAFMTTLHNYGWVGVELFFVISSFLFFHLFHAEVEKAGKIDIAKFYLRRILRLYPLMVLFPIAMLVIFGSPDGLGWFRELGLALFVDNFVTWVRSYNISIPYAAHLWTLSFEFQIYLVIPFAFLLYQRVGKRAFLGLLAAVFAYGFAARLVFFEIGARHPTIWVTPFLQPETVLAGIALSVIRPQWDWQFSAAAAVVAGILFFRLPVPWATSLASAFSYPLAAIMCAGILDSAVRSKVLTRALSFRPLLALGKISFGLYVYHLLCVAYSEDMATGLGFDPAEPAAFYCARFATALVLTVAAAWLSFNLLERPFLLLKEKVTVVRGRPALDGRLLHIPARQREA
jgi:peptidoglycan/LPS O-acetylase OafA/YrhL